MACKNCTTTSGGGGSGSGSGSATALQAFYWDEKTRVTIPFTDQRKITIEVIKDFSVFNPDHITEIERVLNAIAELNLGLVELKNHLQELKSRHPNSYHVDYLARRSLLALDPSLILPPLYQTLPKKVFGIEELRSKEPSALIQKWGHFSDPEMNLDWWREDPGLAMHHNNWHVVYPGDKPVTLERRQGELFAFMHEQMLARYDFERHSLGMNGVHPYPRGPDRGWDKPLEEAYNGKMESFSFRAAQMSIAPLYRLGKRLIVPDEISANRRCLLHSIARGYLDGTPDEDSTEPKRIPTTMHLIGCTMEANKGSVNKKMYGNVHNNGHILLGSINDPEGHHGVDHGPMFENLTAPRDPVFYRWHKYVDSVFEAYRVRLDAYDYRAEENKSELKNPGISLESVVLKTDGMEESNTLHTFMEPRTYDYVFYDRDDIPIAITSGSTRDCPIKKTITKIQLQHTPFQYEFKIQNDRDECTRVVLRVFLVPEEYFQTEDPNRFRNKFVEMDKFVVEVEAKSGVIVLPPRRSEDSSVTLPRQPTIDEIKGMEKIQDQKEIQDKNSDAGGGPWCGCGWPQNLLVPRGTRGGVAARLFVIATDWDKDAVDPTEELPDSWSYCGKKDGAYPDKKPMGFPFDRNWHDTDDNLRSMSFETLTEKLPNATSVLVTIKHSDK